MRFLKRSSLFLALAAMPICLIAPSLAADEKLSPPKKITSVEGITEYQLNNGLKVLLFPDQSKPTVTVNITYFVGSRHEGYGETGMAHLLEHMVFKGTPTFPEIWKDLQEHGAQFNGTTWFDRTNYFETMAATEENLEFGLKLEADRMINSHVAKKDLDSEFSVVRNEFEMGENNPVGVLSERTISTAYLWHNYGKSTIGSREDIERVPIERLQAFYKKFYQPDNAMLVVAGKFDEAKTLNRINEIYGVIPKPTRTLEKTYTVEPPQDGPREVTLARVGDVQAIDMVYHICSATHEDAAPLDVLADVLTANQTGRLYKALVETHLATDVSANAASMHDPGYLEITAEVRTEKSLDEVRKVMLDVIEGLHKTEITKEEVERAKNQFAKFFDLRMNDSGRVAISLTESAASGDWRLLFLNRDRMKAVKPEDVKRVAATYLKPSNRTIGMFTPTKEIDRTIVPPTPDIELLFKDYKGNEELAEGEAFDATPQNIESRIERSKTSTGMKVAYLSKKTRGQRVNGNITLRFGSEATLKGNTDAAGLVGSMLMMGTEKLDRRAIQDKLDQLKANVRIGGGGPGAGLGTINVSIETIRPNLPAVIELVGDLLRNSTFPETEFEKFRKERLASLEQGLSEPEFLAQIELRRRLIAYPASDVRYVKTIQEQIDSLKAVKLEDIKKAYKEFLGASHAEAAFVGDFDNKELGSLLDTTFANWKSPKPYERITMPYKDVKAETLTLKTPDKENSVFVAGTNIQLKDDDADYPAAFMANFLYGGNSSARLWNRLRQKEGLSYGTGSGLQASPFEPSGTFNIRAQCAPQNTAKAWTFAKEELEKFLKDGITQQELDDARNGWLESVKVNLANDGQLTGTLVRDLHLDRNMKFLEKRIADIKALTPEQVMAAAKKYLTADKLVIVSAGDFDKAANPG